VVVDVTAVVVSMKVALELPAGTLTLGGTPAEELLLLNVTNTPPVGAAPLKVTVPMARVPPVTPAGFSDTDDIDNVPAWDVNEMIAVDWMGTEPILVAVTMTVWLKVIVAGAV
jgi:hypothetical protein